MLPSRSSPPHPITYPLASEIIRAISTHSMARDDTFKVPSRNDLAMALHCPANELSVKTCAETLLRDVLLVDPGSPSELLVQRAKRLEQAADDGNFP